MSPIVVVLLLTTAIDGIFRQLISWAFEMGRMAKRSYTFHYQWLQTENKRQIMHEMLKSIDKNFIILRR